MTMKGMALSIATISTMIRTTTTLSIMSISVMRNAKGKQTCSCFEAQMKCVNFFIWQQNTLQHIVFNLVFNEDSKMGSAIFVPFVFKELL